MLSWARVSRTPCFYLHRIKLCLAKITLNITLNRCFLYKIRGYVLFPTGSKIIRGTLRILNFAETRRWSCKQTWRRIVQSLSRSSGNNNFSFWFARLFVKCKRRRCMKAWEWKHGLLESHDHWKIWCRWGPPFSMFTFFDSQICRVIDGALYRCLFLLVVYNFDGKVNHGLPLTIGETVHIFEECSGEMRSSFYPYSTN